jgi:hypothetical protein
MTQTLGTLKSVELRDIWKTEDRDFTPWLAKEEHLKILSESLGFELELEAQEKDVGPFRADILCKNVDDGSWVLIENQIEKTDHRHLGQLMTYAAGLQAVNIVWIASKFQPEHRAAVDWLNEITDEKFRFFALEIELWQIDNSTPAPKFNVISQPNNWSKSISQAAKRISEEAMSDVQASQYKYWQSFLGYLTNEGTQLRLQKPLPQHWQNFTIGKRYFHISALLNTRDNCIGVELNITDNENAKTYFKMLEADKEAIQDELGYEIDWMLLPEKITSKMRLIKEGDPLDENTWPKHHAWMKEHLEKFHSVFQNRVRQLDASEWIEEDAA